MNFSQINAIRESHGLMSVETLMNLSAKGIIIYDPFSTLISKEVKIGEGTIIFPNVSIFKDNSCTIEIGKKNILHSGTRIVANAGDIIIGSENEIGEGGIIINTNTVNSRIVIGNGGRYNGGAKIYGKCQFADGTQVLGNINVTNCVLAKGHGYNHNNPDERGGVIKGFGTLKNREIGLGEVMNCFPTLTEITVERQSKYHPPLIAPLSG